MPKKSDPEDGLNYSSIIYGRDLMNSTEFRIHTPVNVQPRDAAVIHPVEVPELAADEDFLKAEDVGFDGESPNPPVGA